MAHTINTNNQIDDKVMITEYNIDVSISCSYKQRLVISVEIILSPGIPLNQVNLCLLVSPWDGVKERDGVVSPWDGVKERDGVVSPWDGVKERDGVVSPWDGVKESDGVVSLQERDVVVSLQDWDSADLWTD